MMITLTGAMMMIGTEEWRPVKHFEHLYEVSNLGNIRNACTNKVLKAAQNGHGYVYVELGKGNKRYVHRIVAEAFIPNPQSAKQVNHKDENKLNNVVDNLEWCSAQYNKAYSCGRPVEQLLNGKVISTYSSVREAARMLNKNHSHILSCCKKQAGFKTVAGYEWRFKEC